MHFNPLTDKIENEKGEKVLLDVPTGNELPEHGFLKGQNGYVGPAKDGLNVEVIINPESQRLQKLEAFESNKDEDFKDLFVLLKTKGKCTTDHISMAGPWLKYRGHLDNISNNMFIGAVNFFNEKMNSVRNQLTGNFEEVPRVARQYKDKKIGWIIVGEDNYGEGSSREHAAMEPRYLGAKAIVVKSFARIHETNLKKQGLLPFTFADPADYDKIREDDRIDIDVKDIVPGEQVLMAIRHADGSFDKISLNHTLNSQQINWFKAGSALNHLANKKNA